MVTSCITETSSLPWTKINHRLLKYLSHIKFPRTHRGITSRNLLIAELEADSLFADNASSRKAARAKPSRSIVPGRSVSIDSAPVLARLSDTGVKTAPGLPSVAPRGLYDPTVTPRGVINSPEESFSDDYIRRINVSAFQGCKEDR